MIAAVLCLCAAVVVAGAGLWLLSRPRTGDVVTQVLRAVAPTQLAGAVMLAAGGAAALAGASVLLLVICAVGAVGTIGAGCYQAARSVARLEAAQPAGGGCGSGGACASCTLSCDAG